jgi:hypothetical protein
MDLRRVVLAFVALAVSAVMGVTLAPAASAAPASPAAVPAASAALTVQAAPATVQATALRAGYQCSAYMVTLVQRVLGVGADGRWGPVTDRAAWAFERQVYAQWPNQAAKVTRFQQALNWDPYAYDIHVDGAWGSETEYKFRDVRNRCYMNY